MQSPFFLLCFWLLFSIVLSIFTDVFHNWQITNLSRANSQLGDYLTTMNKKIDNIENTIFYLEKNDEDLRIFVDLPRINSDVRKLGIGGHADQTFGQLSSVSGEDKELAIKTQRVIENLSQRVKLALESREEIDQKFRNDQSKFKHTPSIRPIPNARVTSYFSYRRDPFTDKPVFHEGWDLSAPRGTNVLASADGKVVEIKNRYTPNSGYGKYIEIDHGYGLKTKYAHLDKILVKPGEVVTRYTVIGKVGDTGRSTAPHLHYEVMENNKKIDPKDYILD